jgi:hypothetical protein
MRTRLKYTHIYINIYILCVCVYIGLYTYKIIRRKYFLARLNRNAKKHKSASCAQNMKNTAK